MAAKLSIPGVELAALVVIDVVEGTALASLEHMRASLQTVPTHFATTEEVGPSEGGPHSRIRHVGL
jgi:hypothetical protein